MFNQPTESDIDFFISVLGKSHVLTDSEKINPYSKDHTEDLSYKPSVVCLPSDSKEISQILAYCNERRIPVTTYAAGTGLSGGALALEGGLVLSTRRMNRIYEVDKQSLYAVVGSGVINQELRDVVESQGLFYPPDPASLGSSTLGGNIAHSSGGPRAVKYGTTKDYVLNLEVVLANGSIIETGAAVHKNSTAYNLTQLFVGSEGTLGVISKAWLKLIPKPKHEWLLQAEFRNVREASKAVSQILSSGIHPSTLELLESDALEVTYEYLGLKKSAIPPALLLIGIDGYSLDVLAQMSENLFEFLEKLGASEVKLADDSASKERLWSLRRAVGLAVKSISAYKEEDTVVPPARLPELIDHVKELEKKYGFKSYCYGHAGDGNLHVNIVKKGLSDAEWNQILPKAIRELFLKVKELGGRLSGEHGVGLVQKEYLPIFLDEQSLKLLKSIKNIFDPNGILNPGKIFPD